MHSGEGGEREKAELGIVSNPLMSYTAALGKGFCILSQI